MVHLGWLTQLPYLDLKQRTLGYIEVQDTGAYSLSMPQRIL